MNTPTPDRAQRGGGAGRSWPSQPRCGPSDAPMPHTDVREVSLCGAGFPSRSFPGPPRSELRLLQPWGLGELPVVS